MERIITFICAVFLFAVPCSLAYDFTFEIFEPMNTTGDAHIEFNIRSKRNGHTILDYTLNGNITERAIFAKNPENYFMSMRFYYSPLGNNQYQLTPMRIPKTQYCDYMNTYYRKYFMKQSNAAGSNLPYSDDPNEDLCPYMRADHDLVFVVNNYQFDKTKLPRDLPSGAIKIEAIVERDNEVVGGIWAVVRIVNDK